LAAAAALDGAGAAGALAASLLAGAGELPPPAAAEAALLAITSTATVPKKVRHGWRRSAPFFRSGAAGRGGVMVVFGLVIGFTFCVLSPSGFR
jgi:hypothetical protein